MKTAVISIGKLSSKRCLHKLLRPLGHTTVIHHHFELLKQIEADTHLFATRDTFLTNIAQEHGLEVINRPQSSTIGHTFFDIWNPIAIQAMEKKIDRIVWVNACCPMVDPDTVHQAIKKFDGRLVLPVLNIETPYWNIQGEAINERSAVNTQEVNRVYALSHSFWIRTPQMIVDTERNEQYVEQHRNAQLIEITTVENLDIDTEIDYLITNAYFTNLFACQTSKICQSGNQ